MFKLLDKVLNKAKDVPFSLNAIKNKQGCLPMGDILSGKYPFLSVSENIPGFYEVSHILPKTGTQVTLNVDKNGKVLKKSVVLGKDNSASSIIHSTRTLYNTDVVNGVGISVPGNTCINYKLPLFQEANGFSKRYSATPTGWVSKAPTPFRF